MAERWTRKEMNSTDDLAFAMCILKERASSLKPNSPLYRKLNKAICYLNKIRQFTVLFGVWEKTVGENIYKELKEIVKETEEYGGE